MNRPRSRPSFSSSIYDNEDDDEDDKNKNAFTSRKTENEGIQRILSKTVRQAGLILLFDGEVGHRTTVTDRRYNNRDEHSQTDILTSASNRLPAFPPPLMHA